MYDIKYYPVIDCDSDGSYKVPMIPADNEDTVRKTHSLWLKEIVPFSFRLCSTDEGAERLKNPFTLKCPVCGQAMRMVAGAIDEHKHGLYVCDACRR